MRYAMVLNSRVIAIEVSKIKPVYPPDFYGNPIIAIPCGEDVVLGMVYNETTESFGDYIPPEPEPSQLDIIEKEVKKKNTEIAKAAIDNYTLELVKEGVL